MCPRMFVFQGKLCHGVNVFSKKQSDTKLFKKTKKKLLFVTHYENNVIMRKKSRF